MLAALPLCCLLLAPAPAAAAKAKTTLEESVETMAREKKASGSPQAALDRMFSGHTAAGDVQDPAAPARKAAPPAEGKAAPPPMTRAESPPPVLIEKAAPPDPQTAMFQSEKDKISVLAALGYLKIGIMQGGAVAIYGFGALGQVTNHNGGPRGEIMSVVNGAVAEGVLAAVAAATLDQRRYVAKPPPIRAGPESRP